MPGSRRAFLRLRDFCPQYIPVFCYAGPMKRLVTLRGSSVLHWMRRRSKASPKDDYKHGKAAFEMLEQYQRASAEQPTSVEHSASFLLAAAEQMDAIPKKNGALQNSLDDYADAIGARMSAQLSLTTVTIKVESAQLKRNNDASIRALSEQKYTAHRAVLDIEPIIKLCHDDAAQYFDASAASTNTCHSELVAFKTEYPMP